MCRCVDMCNETDCCEFVVDVWFFNCCVLYVCVLKFLFEVLEFLKVCCFEDYNSVGSCSPLFVFMWVFVCMVCDCVCGLCGLESVRDFCVCDYVEFVIGYLGHDFSFYVVEVMLPLFSSLHHFGFFVPFSFVCDTGWYCCRYG